MGDRKESYTRTGYRRVTRVNQRDRWWVFSKFVAQLLILVLIGIAAWVAYGIYCGWIMWPWIVGYWVVLTAKNVCDFIIGRLR